MNSLLIFLFYSSVFSQSVDGFESLSVGHNLSSNTRTLDENQWSLGTLYLGYGLTDQLTFGLSPFVLYQYKMNNFMLRQNFKINQRLRLGFDFAYFKTFGEEYEEITYCSYAMSIEDSICTQRKEHTAGFSMEAMNLKSTLSYLIQPFYRLNTTISYFYYINEDMPFSFRMDPANNDKYALNLTTLHEFRMSKNIFINLEAGFWGLNYQYLYYHSGLTLNFQNERLLFSLGASSTFSPSFPVERARTFVGYDSRSSIHPEIQVQTFF